MWTHDYDPAREAAHRPPAKKDEGEGSASRALAEGRPSSLDKTGLMHLQRAAGNASVNSFLAEDQERSPVLDVVGSGGGQPLDRDTRTEMETNLGHDFSDVKVHTGGKASESAKSVQAQAYTVGNDIVFGGDNYSPGTSAGKRMLAHELTHVVQQRSGPVDGTPASGGVSISDPSDRFEQAAEQSADRVMAGPASTPSAGPAVQRDADEAALEEQPVQREAAPEEELPEEEEQQAPS
jgi:Domain of unknown function (DUF4157)